jgi:17beta-estradiol 17-dehydrogenase / very-long-chain 3-oxoacyl-CoA reductase
MNEILWECVDKFFLYFGYLALTTLLLYLLSYLPKIYEIFIKNLYLDEINTKKYSKWAVVTGCTDVIGKGYAKNLTKKGFNIVLLSRSLNELNEFSSQLFDKYKVKTKVIAADFTGNILKLILFN